jgi:iron-sulfur cluster repair protein YtfE (RIC family)
MDPTTLLKRDHEVVKSLFKEYEAAGDQAYVKKKHLFQTIKGELEIHMDIEETIFYPALKSIRRETIKDEVREADEEHHVVKVLLGEISKLRPEDEQYDAKITVLQENIEHHVKEEEGEMFPDARKHLTAEKLAQLGEEMEERKEVLQGEV